MASQPDLTRLEGYRLSGRNLAVECSNCGHRGVVDGPKLWRIFAVHRWPNEITRVGKHLRCSICKRRPTSLTPTDDTPSLDPFPKDEVAWQHLVKRLRN